MFVPIDKQEHTDAHTRTNTPTDRIWNKLHENNIAGATGNTPRSMAGTAVTSIITAANHLAPKHNPQQPKLEQVLQVKAWQTR